MFTFEAEVIHWRGPPPYYFAATPAPVSAEIGKLAKSASYGWGVIPVAATIDGVAFTTSMIPRQGIYLLPLKDAVRSRIAIPDSGSITVEMTVVAKQ